ncbi:MAG: ABC transporter permease, partial [Bacteroidetes bacterium]
MLKSYITLAVRSFRKNRVFSLVNVSGIGLSLAAFLFILEYISFETSVDRFHQRLPDISRVIFESENQEYGDYSPGAMAPLLKERLAEVEGYCRVLPAETGKGIVSFTAGAGGQDRYSFREEKAIYADAGLFQLFSLPLVTGAADLGKPNTVAISRSQALKYYQREEVTGNVISLNNQFGQTPYTIVAVFEDLPANSTLQFDMVFSLQTLANPANLNGNDWADINGWESSFLTSYVLLDPRADRLATEGRIQSLQKTIFPESKDLPHLQAMAHVHLPDGLSDPYPTQGNLAFLYALG